MENSARAALRFELSCTTAYYEGDELRARFLAAVERYRVRPHETFLIVEAGMRRGELGLLFALQAIRGVYGVDVDAFNETLRIIHSGTDTRLSGISLVRGFIYTGETLRAAHRIVRFADHVLQSLASEQFHAHWPDLSETARSILASSRVKSAVV